MNNSRPVRAEPGLADSTRSQSASPFARRLLAVWRTEFPLNGRTLLFCFFMGSVLSIPVGLLLVVRWELVEPPLWTAPFYSISALGSGVTLPFWSAFALRDQPLLRRMGMTTGVLFFVAIVLGLLFPRL